MGNATACAQTVVRELVAQGVREVVLAPGSRSAPLAYALHAADQAGSLRLHVRIDERTAGFLALGLAKGSEAPVAVVTTSGTAVAHLHPAVLEAWHAHLPLVIVSADRPRSMVHTGANQTTHQDQLFAAHVRAQAGLSDAADEPDAWRFETARLVVAATGARTRTPGPVHLNVALSEPLVPVGLSEQPSAQSVDVAAQVAAPPVPLSVGPRTIVVAGDLAPRAGHEVAALAAAAAIPLLAEPSSNARGGSTAISAYRLLLGSALAEQVQRVVMFGRPTLSRPVTRLLGRSEVDLVVVSNYADWPDPGRAARRVVGAISIEKSDPDWLTTWLQHDREVGCRLAELLEGQSTLTGPALAREVWTALGADDVLFAGASNPIRDLDLVPASGQSPAVYANRGLSGIDGSISTASGVGMALGRPVTALLGDLTAIHDLTGLVLGPDEPRPDLRLVVANDDGGSIFATLEHGAPEHAETYERIFGTPHRVGFRALAGAVGAAYRQVSDRTALVAALSGSPDGLELIEAVVDRSGRRALSQAILELAGHIR